MIPRSCECGPAPPAPPGASQPALRPGPARVRSRDAYTGRDSGRDSGRDPRPPPTGASSTPSWLMAPGDAGSLAAVLRTGPSQRRGRGGPLGSGPGHGRVSAAELRQGLGLGPQAPVSTPRALPNSPRLRPRLHAVTLAVGCMPHRQKPTRPLPAALLRDCSETIRVAETAPRLSESPRLVTVTAPRISESLSPGPACFQACQCPVPHPCAALAAAPRTCSGPCPRSDVSD